jgi:hypothetical protein
MVNMHNSLYTKGKKLQFNQGVVFQVDERCYKHKLESSEPLHNALLKYAVTCFNDEHISALMHIYHAIHYEPFETHTGNIFTFDNQNPSDYMIHVARYLYDRYLSQHSEKQINIPFNVTEDVELVKSEIQRLLSKIEEKNNLNKDSKNSKQLEQADEKENISENNQQLKPLEEKMNEMSFSSIEVGADVNESNKHIICRSIWIQLAKLQDELESFINGSIMIGFNEWIQNKEQSYLLENLKFSPFSPKSNSDPVIEIDQQEIQPKQTYYKKLLVDLLVLFTGVGSGTGFCIGIFTLNKNPSSKTGLSLTIAGGIVLLLTVLIICYRCKKSQSSITEQNTDIQEQQVSMSKTGFII